MDSAPQLVLELNRLEDAKPDPHRDAINEITDKVVDLIVRGIEDPETGFNDLSPRTLIAVIVNNIMLNLFFCSTKESASIELKLESAKDLIAETSKLFIACIEKTLTMKAKTEGGKH